MGDVSGASDDHRTLVTGNLECFPPGCRGPVAVMPPRAAWDRFVGLELT